MPQTNPNITNLSLKDGEQWTGVALVHDGSNYGSCVVHESGLFVLTAGHMLENLDLSQTLVSFDLSGRTVIRDIIASALYPGYLLTASSVWHDLGLLVLDQSAPRGADRYELYRERDEVGQRVDLVGYGPDEVRQAGENTVQGLASAVMREGSLDDQLYFRYDTGAMISPGDSGGGMFIQEEEPMLAGIHSHLLNTEQDAVTYDVGVSTRISSYARWIDQTTGLVQDPEAMRSPPPTRDSVPLQVDEGEGVWFLVQLGTPVKATARVDFHTRDGSALGGFDYVPTQGTLSLKPGEQWAKIWVQTLADDRIEGDETFSLVLDNPEGASFPDNLSELTAQRTIHDDITLTGVTELEPELYAV